MSAANVDLAQTYARAGALIFPCHEAGDTAKRPYTRRGYNAATANPSTLHFWSMAWPNAIYGLPCAPNNLFVLDADRHGNGDGVRALAAIFAHYGFDWLSVPVVRTPRDGLHVLFARPAGLGRTKGTVAPAIDVRDNGYIIAPGNVLPNGRRYELLNGTIDELAPAIASGTLPPIPRWLISLATKQPSLTFSAKATASGILPVASRGTASGRITGLIETVRKAGNGERNKALHWAACRVGEMAAQQGIIPRCIDQHP